MLSAGRVPVRQLCPITSGWQIGHVTYSLKIIQSTCDRIYLDKGNTYNDR